MKGIELSKSKNEEVKHRNKINGVVYSIKPFFVFENLFGIFRFGEVNKELVPLSINKKIMVVLICFVYLAACPLMYLGPLKINPDWKIVKFIDPVPSIVATIQYVACIISCFLVGEQTRRILNTVADLDNKLRININEDFYKNSRIYLIKILILFLTVHIVCISIDLSKIWNDNLMQDYIY